MANYERDKDDVRVFDGGEDDDDGEGSHLPVVIIIAILVLAAFGGVVWLAYNQGVARGRGDVQPRIAVAAQPGSAADGSGIKVYQQPAAGEEEDGTAAKQPAPAAVQPAPAPAAASQASPQAVAPAAATPQPVPQAAQPVKIAAPAAVKTTAPPPAPVKTAEAAPPPAAATKPPATLGLAHPAPAAAAPSASKPVAVAPPPAATPKTAPVKAAGGSVLLQVGAYKSEAEALTAWKTYQSKHAALLAGFGPDVQKADLGDKGTWYRLRIASFADKDAATALCDRLKAQNANCFLAH